MRGEPGREAEEGRLLPWHSKTAIFLAASPRGSGSSAEGRCVLPTSQGLISLSACQLCRPRESWQHRGGADPEWGHRRGTVPAQGRRTDSGQPRTRLWSSSHPGSRKPLPPPFLVGTNPPFSLQNEVWHQAMTLLFLRAARSWCLPAAPSLKGGAAQPEHSTPGFALPCHVLSPTCSSAPVWQLGPSSRGRQGSVHRQARPSCTWAGSWPSRWDCVRRRCGEDNKHSPGKPCGLEVPVLHQSALWVYAALGVSPWDHSSTRGSQPPSIPPTGFAGARCCQVQHLSSSITCAK